MPGASSLHAAIDLGSNSFHMLVVREISGSLQTVAKVKRKVRLAAGLNQDNQLSEEAMIRGWQCLHLFSEQIKALPETQIRVVATATLRIASNAQQFLVKALQILGVPVEVISGEEEARLIYQGVAQTTSGSHQRLVVDIGGGSTELVTGSGTQATSLFSLPMGCVTWLEKYFPSRYLTRENFDRAEQAAREMIRPVKQTLCQHGWEICVGVSGTVQALQEIMLAQGMDEQITPGKLRQLRQPAIQCGKLEELDIEGLTLERALVFPSGLAILLAIFHELNISGMSLAGGALREGLIYGMLDMPVVQDIRMRTLASVQHRYGLDIAQANRVTALAVRFCRQLREQWAFDEHAQQMLSSAAALHEIGLTVSFRQAPQHAAYLLSQMELPGFTPAQKQLLAALLVNQQGNIDISRLAQQSILAPHQAERLCRLLRLAIIMCLQRSDEALTDIKMEATDDDLTLILPEGWLANHPLRTELLLQESHLQSNVYWPLNVR